MQQTVTVFEEAIQRGFDLTKKEWESLTQDERNLVIKIIKEHKHEGFFKSWVICGTEDHKRIYGCGICGQYRHDKNFNPYVFDEDL